MADSLKTLKEFNIPVKSVLDVGVQAGTKPLMAAFPKLQHYLFEPVDAYFGGIREAYAGLAHTLVQVALSDVDGDAWQLGICCDGSGRVTHSQVSDRPVSVSEDPRLVECKRIRRARLDTVLKGLGPPKPWLLKIDVDGHEVPILRGATDTLRDASIVVVEAPLPSLAARAQMLMDQGFRLFDVVDLSYYYGTLSQVDLVFVSNEVAAASPDLRPWETKPFRWDAWMPLGDNCFDR